MGKRTWRVEVSGQSHAVEVQMNTVVGMATGAGRLLVDGKVVKEWAGSWTSAVPKELSAEIAGHPVVIRRKGVVSQKPVLFLDGAEVQPL